MEIVTVAPPTGGGDLVAFIRQAGKITPGVQECREVDLAKAADLIDPKHGSTNPNRKRARPSTNVTPETAGTTKAKIMAEIETYCKDTCNGSIEALSSLLTVRGFSQPDIGTALKKAFPSTTTPSQTQDTRITATSSSQRHLDNPTPSALAQQNPYVDKLFLSYRDNKKWYITLTPNATTEEWSATIVTWPLPGKDHVGITYLGTEIVNGFWTATQLSISLEPLCNANGLKSEVRKIIHFQPGAQKVDNDIIVLHQVACWLTETEPQVPTTAQAEATRGKLKKWWEQKQDRPLQYPNAGSMGHEIMHLLMKGLIKEQTPTPGLTADLSEILTQLEPTAVDAQSWLHTCAQSARKAQHEASKRSAARCTENREAARKRLHANSVNQTQQRFEALKTRPPGAITANTPPSATTQHHHRLTSATSSANGAAVLFPSLLQPNPPCKGSSNHRLFDRRGPNASPSPGTDAGETSGNIEEDLRPCDDTEGGGGSSSSSNSSINSPVGGRNLPGQDQWDEDKFPNRKCKRDDQEAEANKRPKTNDFPGDDLQTSSGVGKTRKREDPHGSPTKETRGGKISKGSHCAMDLRKDDGPAGTRYTATGTGTAAVEATGAATAGGSAGAVTAATETAMTTGATSAAVTAGARAEMGKHSFTRTTIAFSPPPGYPPGWPTAPYYKESAAGAACRLGQPAETRPMGTATGAAAVEAVGAATAAGVAGAGAVTATTVAAVTAGTAAGTTAAAGVGAGDGRPTDAAWRAMSKRQRRRWCQGRSK